MDKRWRKGLSKIVTTVILTSLVVTIGFVVMGVAAGWNLTTAESYRKSVEAAINRQKSVIFIEHIQVIGGTGKIFISNPGTVPLRIYDLAYRIGSTSSSLNSPGRMYGQYLIRLDDGSTLLEPGELSTVTFDITGSGNIIIRVYAVAAAIYDPLDYGKNQENGVYDEYGIQLPQQ